MALFDVVNSSGDKRFINAFEALVAVANDAVVAYTKSVEAPNYVINVNSNHDVSWSGDLATAAQAAVKKILTENARKQDRR